MHELPAPDSRQAKGRYLGNMLPLRENERVQSVIATRDFREGEFLLFATKQGVVKKTEFLAYNTPIKADGIIAIKVRDDDELIQVRRTSGDDDVLMVSRARPGRPLPRVRRALHGSRHERRGRHERVRRRQLGARRWTSPATIRSCW